MNNINKAEEIIDKYRDIFTDINSLEKKMSLLQEERNVLLKRLEDLRNYEVKFMNSLSPEEKDEILNNVKHG